LPESVQNLVLYPQDDDAVAALRLAVRQALRGDPGLAADVRALLSEAGVTVVASGERSVAAGEISGIVVTGDNASIG
jgi:hypothetical protein